MSDRPTPERRAELRERLIDQLTRLKVRVPVSGPLAGKVLADSMADALMPAVEPLLAEIDRLTAERDEAREQALIAAGGGESAAAADADLDYVPLVSLVIVDMADTARRVFGETGAQEIAGGSLPEHDYRFQLIDGHRRTTCGYQYTAADIMAHLAARYDEYSVTTELRWRVGRKVGRTIYLDDQLCGMMDTPELARQVVDALNARSAR
jgi:hypothetical protein